MVWEATTPLEGAKRGAQGKVYLLNIYARYKRDLSDKFYEPAKSVVLATEKYVGLVRKWVDKDLSDEDLFKCKRMCEEFEKCKAIYNGQAEEY